MKTFALIPGTNKFAINNNQWRFTNSRSEFIAQKIRHTVSIFKGEWFLDREIGIPYIPEDGWEASMHRRMIETALQVRIGDIDGVERFVRFETSMDKAKRELTVNFTVQLDTGDTYSDSVEIGV